MSFFFCVILIYKQTIIGLSYNRYILRHSLLSADAPYWEDLRSKFNLLQLECDDEKKIYEFPDKFCKFYKRRKIRVEFSCDFLVRKIYIDVDNDDFTVYVRNEEDEERGKMAVWWKPKIKTVIFLVNNSRCHFCKSTTHLNRNCLSYLRKRNIIHRKVMATLLRSIF